MATPPNRRYGRGHARASDAGRRRRQLGGSAGGGGRACAPRCCSAHLGCWPALARLFAQFETDWLWFKELGQERVFWTILASKWLAASLAGLATTAFLLANFWVVERTAPRDARLPRDRPSTARLRHILLPAYLALSAGARARRRPQRRRRGLAAAPPLAPPQRLRHESIRCSIATSASSSSPCRCTRSSPTGCS